MDKYEYNLKLEEIDKLVDQGDYEEAANLADTIEWRRVRNVRTLSLMSEIYEAAGKLEESKDMLVRAYRKSPVGRNVLYRLVEVTTELGEYDEALEYYAEYVQAAPHDNNRYILKYKIYRGRGSSTEELIAILEEYLGLEYTERWAYELALLYQEAGQIQKCMATCDDLVLWFHSGKYVRKALELKKRYAVLTPKQKQIYEICLQEEAQSDYFDDSDEDVTVFRKKDDADDDVLAENIIAETEKEIAGEISARKAEREKSTKEQLTPMTGPLAENAGKEGLAAKEEQNDSEDEQEMPAKASARDDIKSDEKPSGKQSDQPAQKSSEPGLFSKVFRKNSSKPSKKGQENSSAQPSEPAGAGREGHEEAWKDEPEMMAAVYDEEPEMATAVYDEPEASEPEEYDDLQVEMAKSVRKVISGVARKPELNEDDVPVTVEERLRSIQEVSRRKEPEPVAGKLSIDDILLAMGEKGKQAAAAARAEREAAAAEEASITEDTSAAEKVSVAGSAPVAEAMPAAESASVVEAAPAAESASVAEAAPAAESASVAEAAPAAGNASAAEAVPMSENESAAEEVPMSENESAAEEVPVSENESAAEEVPVSENESAAEEVPVSESVSAAEAVSVSESESAAEEVLAAENASAAKEAPVSESVLAEEETPVREEASVAEKATVAEKEYTGGMNAAAEAVRTGDMNKAETDAARARRERRKTPQGKSVAAVEADELTQEQLEALRYSTNPEKFLRNRNALPTYVSEEESRTDDPGATRKFSTKEELLEAARQELMSSKTIRIPDEEVAKAYSHRTEGLRENEANGSQHDSTDAGVSIEPGAGKTDLPYTSQEQNGAKECEEAAYEKKGKMVSEASVQELGASESKAQAPETVAEEESDEEYFDDPLTLAPYHREMFAGFTEVEGLEDQIANSILQAMAKGNDRTSRNGNILIFGAHGSGKTTLATNIAKAIAQEKGRQTVKMAKIYAVDLNRRDIAATVAKIAGGTLIIEEAGDLEDNTVEQLTTAMEFRTDGLIVILEDEQRYLHSLLMNHPRFTMKFTAQIYLPSYTVDELCMFAIRHANSMDYSISEDGLEVIRQKVAQMSSTETPMSIGDVVTLVDQAIRHSNKFMRKMSMGKKRYDENDFVVLFAKDFK